MNTRKLSLFLTLLPLLVFFSACEKDSDISPSEVENVDDHEDSGDYTWDESEVIQITLNGNSISIDTPGVASIDGSQITITSAFTYEISGSLSDGQILVNTQDEDVVRLIFNGINISNSSNAPIYIKNAEKTIIVLADNTTSYLSDGSSYVYEYPAEDDQNAAIYSKDDLTIYGNGTLKVIGNYNDGITSKDGLLIKSGTIEVSSVDDGIRGKDYLVIKDGDITINADGDGLKSDNDEDAAKGYITIENGTFDITSGGDAIQAVTDVWISNGDISTSAGGGSNSSISESASAKGIKAGVSLIVDNGNFNINTADDAIHSNASLTINGGTFSIASGDDGIHADSSLTINNGDFNITKCYEGIESSIITINDGNINVTASDDGLNVAGGNDGSGMTGGPGKPGQDNYSSSVDYYMYLNGGYIAVESDGDGLDANGSIVMTGGTVIVNGPTGSDNGALDYDGSFKISGGILVAVGSSGMLQAPGTSSSQNSVSFTFSSTVQSGTIFHIQTSAGDEVLTFAPSKKYQSVVFSSSELIKGSSYSAYKGGSSTGTENNGLYQNGTYTPGSLYKSFTISSVVTTVR